MPILERKIFVFFYLFFFLSTSDVIAIESDVKVAVIHFEPHFQQVSSNPPYGIFLERFREWTSSRI